MGGVGQMQPPDPPVEGIGPALDKPRFGKSVDHPGQGNRLDLKQIGEFALGLPLPPVKIEEHAPLRPGHPDIACTRVKPIADMPRHVVQQKGYVVLRIHKHA